MHRHIKPGPTRQLRSLNRATDVLLRIPFLALLALLFCILVGCDDSGNNPDDVDSDLAGDMDQMDSGDSTDLDASPDTIEPVFAVKMEFGPDAAFFDQPFPSETRRRMDGGISLQGWPLRNTNGWFSTLTELIERDASGFGRSSAIYVPLTASPDIATLPTAAESTSLQASVQLLNMDPDSPQVGQRYPFDVSFAQDNGPFAGKDLLRILPIQGVPLPGDTLMGVVVTTRLMDETGASVQRAPAVDQLLDGTRPEGMPEAAFGSYQTALTALEDISAEQIAGITVFRTGTPTLPMKRAVEQVLADELPTPNTPFTLIESYDDFCVYQSTIDMPVFQDGEPPFTDSGGSWQFAGDGTLAQTGTETSRIFVTLPRATQPANGFPTVLFVRTGGGGDRPLIDRGVRAEEGGPAVEEGSGPARNFARAGVAGIMVDGPHGGPRNVTNGDEQFLMFNVTNPPAMRDNVRQSALELSLFGEVIPGLAIDASACADLADDEVRLDGDRLALMGHSMGATISPLSMATNPRFKALILSGAGGSWIENVVYKQRPLEVKPLAEILLGYGGFELTSFDPALSLLQWAGEGADPPLYGREIMYMSARASPPHVLMLQGIVDTYILPPIANSLSIALQLSLAGPALDSTDPGTTDFRSLTEMLQFSEGSHLMSWPVADNFKWEDEAAATAVVVQHQQGPVEDGHEIAFQTEAPKLQYRCFLETWLATGTPRVVEPLNDEWAACN